MIAISEGETDQLKLESSPQKPYFVPDSKPTAELFREMQKTQYRMAVLIDEFGGFSGITTTEDLVEEIVGDLHDEYEQGGTGSGSAKSQRISNRRSDESGRAERGAGPRWKLIITTQFPVI